MKTQSLTIDNPLDSMFSQLTVMEEQIAIMRKQLLKFVKPKYGSEAWWEQEEKEADADIKAGRVSGPFKDMESLLQELHRK